MFISEPCKLSSILLLCNVPYTIYVRNYTILWTQIPVGVTSILLHHNIYRKIRLTDNVFANLALLQHSYHSYLFGNHLSNFFYLLTPMIFVISKILLYKKKHYSSQVIHACMHFALCIATISLNISVSNQSISQSALSSM